MINRVRAIGMIATLLLVALFVKSCQPEEPTGPQNTTGTVIGKITEVATTVVSGALVTITNDKGSQSDTTDTNGDFLITMDFGDTNPRQSTMKVTKSNYLERTLTITLTPGQTVTQNATIQRDTGSTAIKRGTGVPNTIAFISASTNELSVFGVGGKETAVLLFEARDSLGIPIDGDVADTVVFSPAGAPVLGGAFVSPNSVKTNAAGRVATTINSGTVSGSIQVTATIRRDVDGKLIQSLPIRLLVHGGMPDSNHISVAASVLNVPGLNYYGLTSIVTAYVGDKYGNPVAPGTAVHFSTNQGIITTAGAFTGTTGQAQGTLYSALPIQANGFGTVTARTIGISGSPVSASMPILFSGEPFISAVVVTGSLNVDNTTQGTVSFRVTDSNGNPVAAGTNVSVSIKGASAVASDISPANQIPDTQSQNWTQFSFVVSKDQDVAPPKLGPYTVTIVVQHPGPYGGSKVTRNGVVN